ncbi:MAG: biotin transporter BioY [Erysipelotrichaceae bacterium]
MKSKDMTQCALFAASLGVLAQISIPLPFGVPFTLQVVGVILAGMLLGPKKGAMAVGLYLFMGAIGLPVFSNFESGLSQLFGMTGGFLWSFPLFALIVGYGVKKSNTSLTLLGWCLLGATLNYACGSLQFMMITNHNLQTTLLSCVTPFLLFDLCKWVLCVVYFQKKSVQTLYRNLQFQ